MARALRIQYPGACYHVTSRGNERKDIYNSQRDRESFLSGVYRRALWSGYPRLLPDEQPLSSVTGNARGQPVANHAPYQRRLYHLLQRQTQTIRTFFQGRYHGMCEKCGRDPFEVRFFGIFAGCGVLSLSPP